MGAAVTDDAREPRSAAEALRMMAWQFFENARDLHAAAKRETVSPYHDTMLAEARTWHDAATVAIADAEALEPQAAELTDKERRALVVAWFEECPSVGLCSDTLNRFLARLEAVGLAVTRKS